MADKKDLSYEEVKSALADEVEEGLREHKHTWYIVQVATVGAEQRIADDIISEVERRGLSPLIKEVFIPQIIVETSRKSKETKKGLYPGYLFMHMILTDGIYSVIAKPGRARLLNKNKVAAPMSDAEVEKIKKQLEENTFASPYASIHVGDMVRVCDGPFLDFEGTVQEIDEERKRLSIVVFIFDRPTPVSLAFSQVEPLGYRGAEFSKSPAK